MPHRLLPFLLAPVVLAAACSTPEDGARRGRGAPGVADGTGAAAVSGVATIDITLSDAGCEPRSLSAKAGPTTFRVVNDGSAAVTEFEVLRDGRVIAEVENVIAGVDRSFSLTLDEGGYETKCPGGEQFDTGTLQVAPAMAGTVVDDAARTAAVADYLAYVRSEADALIAAVQPFATAVRAGDIDTAKARFAAARLHYETIEPIAEAFGELDPAIDAREGDVPDAEWGGFHRIERALWVEEDLTGMDVVADRLLADVERLRAGIDTLELEPAQIANGAVALLDEVSTSKITGEEDRYSHTDLSDFAGNLAGSQRAYQSVRPLLAAADAGLAATIDQRFTAVGEALGRHAGTDPVGNGYALYDTLTAEHTRALSAALDTLAEPLSLVAAIVL